METITTSPAGVSVPSITVLVDVPDGMPIDTVLLFGGEDDYFGTPMVFESLGVGARKYRAEYTLPNPNGSETNDIVFRVRVQRSGLLGPFSAPFTVTYKPPLITPEIVNFTGTPVYIQPA